MKRRSVWPAGRTWVYQVSITNGAGGGGEISATIVPGEGNEMEIIAGNVRNGDTSTRTGDAQVRDDDDNFLYRVLQTENIVAGASRSFPAAQDVIDNNAVGAGQRLILSGGMKLFMLVSAVAASQDAVFALTARIRGGPPTATEAGNSTPTITINKERVF